MKTVRRKHFWLIFAGLMLISVVMGLSLQQVPDDAKMFVLIPAVLLLGPLAHWVLFRYEPDNDNNK